MRSACCVWFGFGVAGCPFAFAPGTAAEPRASGRNLQGGRGPHSAWWRVSTRPQQPQRPGASRRGLQEPEGAGLPASAADRGGEGGEGGGRSRKARRVVGVGASWQVGAFGPVATMAGPSARRRPIAARRTAAARRASTAAARIDAGPASAAGSSKPRASRGPQGRPLSS